MSELNKHWADKLQSGDRCLATIRHDYDGSKNIHRAIVIVIENMRFVKEVFVWYKEKQISIPYNELTEFDPHEVSTVTCNLCSYSWIAVRPEGLTELECPNCGNLSHFQNQAAGEYKYLSMIKSDYSQMEVEDLKKRKTELEAKLPLSQGQDFMSIVEELNVIKVILMDK